MDSQVVERTFNFNVANENAAFSVKNSQTVSQTPRKLPFSDQTNRGGLLRSALKSTASKAENSKAKQSTSSKAAQQEVSSSIIDDFDFEPFSFPPDKNCYCCGDDRKTDGEVWGEKLAFSEEFLNRLDSVPMRLQEKFPEPPSPVKIQRPSITSSPNFDIDLDMEMCALPEVNFDDSFDDSRYRSALEFPDLKDDDSHSILEVPDCDTDNDDMSFGNDTVDNSILHDW